MIKTYCMPEIISCVSTILRLCNIHCLTVVDKLEGFHDALSLGAFSLIRFF